MCRALLLTMVKISRFRWDSDNLSSRGPVQSYLVFFPSIMVFSKIRVDDNGLANKKGKIFHIEHWLVSEKKISEFVKVV